MTTTIKVNEVHITMDDMLVKMQNALKGSETDAKQCLEDCFPPMYNMIHQLQNRVQFLELRELELEDKIKELEE